MGKGNDFEYCKELGEQYQDFITLQLAKMGIVIANFSSKKYQMCFGENNLHCEIKRDSKWQQTGRLYIEFEAISKDGSKMIDGGIKKNDFSWLYLIGDETKAYIFAKNQLIRLYQKVKEKPDVWKEKYGIKIYQHIDPDSGKVTSSGMCVPVNALNRIGICIKELTFKEENK